MNQTRDMTAALDAFRRHGGLLRTGAALAAGIHPETFYRLAEEGRLIRVARGLYRLAEAEEFSNPDLVVAALKAPGAVVCLISALSFHGITTQIPKAVHLAVPRGKYASLRLRSPPVKVYRFDPVTFEEGIEAHRIDGTDVRIYGVARTLVDCFKYRNKIGLDVAVEALRLARVRKRISNRAVLPVARLLRQERVMAPYLEALT